VKGAANPMDMPDRRILVTGAASGIGRATAVLLSRLGAKVACADVNRAGIDETMGLLAGDGHTPWHFDFRNIHAAGDWLAALAASFGPLHGFVHAAGIPAPLPLKALSIEKWREVFLVNTEAALVLAKAFPSRRVYAGASGSSVFISSVMAQVGSPGAIAYSLSKAALDGVTRSLAMELAPRRIRVNSVAPGFVCTPMFQQIEHLWTAEQRVRLEEMHPLGFGQPEDVANAVAFLLADSARWITGSILVVDGGYTAQ
jgi:NAD(P)-dependent dehydrogenase (short-subunit alcohol dehydrogenase family)